MVKLVIIKSFFCCLLLLFCSPSFATTPDQQIADRVVVVSQQFLGSPYQFDPLGEGSSGRFSQKPLYRFDCFDCQTYVETVLAMALPGNFDQNILMIRYHYGVPGFFDRNHFPETDWIPNNEAHGFVKDITTFIAPPSAIATKKITIDYQDWYRALGTHRFDLQNKTGASAHVEKMLLMRQAESVSNKTTAISYIRSGAVPQIIQAIPNGSIIMIVDPKNIPGTSILISHMGFAIWKNHQLYFRAASSQDNRVEDLPLQGYLKEPYRLGIVVLIPV